MVPDFRILLKLREEEHNRYAEFGKQHPITVKTLAGSVHTLTDWAFCADLRKLLAAQHPELGDWKQFVLQDANNAGDGTIDPEKGSADRVRMLLSVRKQIRREALEYNAFYSMNCKGIAAGPACCWTSCAPDLEAYWDDCWWWNVRMAPLDEYNGYTRNSNVGYRDNEVAFENPMYTDPIAAAAAAAASPNYDDNDIRAISQDPELKTLRQDPEVMLAMQDLQDDPSSTFYKSNPKVAAYFARVKDLIHPEIDETFEFILTFGVAGAASTSSSSSTASATAQLHTTSNGTASDLAEADSRVTMDLALLAATAKNVSLC